MAAFSLAALAAEINNDPAGLGYAASVADGADGTIADLLNDATGPGSASVPLPMVSRDAFLTGVRPGLLALASLDAAVQAKWDRILGVIRSVDSVLMDATSIALMSAAVADGVLTQGQADAVWHRTGSRAEVLWGAGCVITHSIVGQALRG